jgi:hypothetical protein
MAGEGGARSGKAAARRTRPGTTGRVTPKGTGAKGTGGKGTGSKGQPAAGQSAPPSGRYTPPVRREVKVSPRWVPILMFALLGVGVAVIILNYLGVLPGGSDNRYLLLGLAAITGGFVTATQYR